MTTEAGDSTLNHQRFLVILGVAVLALCAPILALNFSADPLWYGAGNRLGNQRNLVLNERVSKSNWLLQDPKRYDCLILGSSRTTLLSPTSFPGYECFNYAVSQASFEDMVALATFAEEHLGKDVRLLVVGVDTFNLVPDTFFGEQALPQYISTLSAPPHEAAAYLARSVAKLSWQTKTGDSKLPRFYEHQDGLFIAQIPPEAQRFVRPSQLTLRPSPEDRFDQFPQTGFSAERLRLLKPLRKLFPQAKLVGYVPPVKPSYLRKVQAQGALDDLLRAEFAATNLFDEFWDFSLPSELTRSFDETPDGSHYSLAINQRIAHALLGQETSDGFKLGKDFSRFKAKALAALEQDTQQSPLPSVEGTLASFRND